MKNFSDELKEAIFSQETANTIFKTCKRNGILEKTSELEQKIFEFLERYLKKN